MTPEQIWAAIERETGPSSEMTQEKALEYLKELSALIEGGIEGLRDDLENKEED